MSRQNGEPAADTRVGRLPRLGLTRRGVQVGLGAIWLLDGLLQFQSFMYTHAFVSSTLEPGAAGQPGVIGTPISVLAHFYGHDLTLWNTLAAEIQCAIGLGLLIGRRFTRPALLLGFAWAPMVWWFGEGLGMLFTSGPVSPLMGAPGAVIVYGLIGALVWPKRDDTQDRAVDGGLLGAHGGNVLWSALWLQATVLWFLHSDRSPSAIHDQISEMASASPHWLATLQNSAANSAQGHGVEIATVLGLASLLIALAVWTPLRTSALILGVVLSLVYWVYGQSLGGPFWVGDATDVNAGPLFVLLALALLPVRSAVRTPAWARKGRRSTQETAPAL